MFSLLASEIILPPHLRRMSQTLFLSRYVCVGSIKIYPWFILALQLILLNTLIPTLFHLVICGLLFLDFQYTNQNIGRNKKKTYNLNMTVI